MSTVLITGANRGIGLAFAELYSKKGFDVIAACREASSDLKKLDVKIVENVDVSQSEVQHHLREAVGKSKLDIVINNAGILRDEQLGKINYKTLTEQFEVNSVGPLRVTEALLPNLQSGSKIALITSRMGSIDDNTSGGRYGYRMSKAALNIAGKSLAHDLKSLGVAVAILHPGFVQTDMVNHGGDISAETAAERLMQRIDELTMENTGTFWHSKGEILPW